jgi:hypothetical protein
LRVHQLNQLLAMTPDTIFSLIKHYNIFIAFFISHCRGVVKLVEDLRELGSTALGSALTLSVGMACEHTHAEVILCTDGLPNVGLGMLQKSSADYDPGFYTKVSQIKGDPV